ncbi:MAG: hypothetical protein ABH821_03510 [archaeon]
MVGEDNLSKVKDRLVGLGGKKEKPEVKLKPRKVDFESLKTRLSSLHSMVPERVKEKVRQKIEVKRMERKLLMQRKPEEKTLPALPTEFNEFKEVKVIRKPVKATALIEIVKEVKKKSKKKKTKKKQAIHKGRKVKEVKKITNFNELLREVERKQLNEAKSTNLVLPRRPTISLDKMLESLAIQTKGISSKQLFPEARAKNNSQEILSNLKDLVTEIRISRENLEEKKQKLSLDEARSMVEEINVPSLEVIKDEGFLRTEPVQIIEEDREDLKFKPKSWKTLKPATQVIEKKPVTPVIEKQLIKVVQKTEDVHKTFKSKEKVPWTKILLLKEGEQPFRLKSSELKKVETISLDFQVKDYSQVSETVNINESVYAKISWNSKQKNLAYQLIEPPITVNLKEKLEKLNQLLFESLDETSLTLTEIEKKESYLEDKIDDIITGYGFGEKKEDVLILKYYLKRDFLGLGKINALMKDKEIEEINCLGVNMPVFVYHKKYGSMQSNIAFDSIKELTLFVERLAEATGNELTLGEPCLIGFLPNNSKVEIIYSTGKLSSKGSSFVISKKKLQPLTVMDFFNKHSMLKQLADYLWLGFENNYSMLLFKKDNRKCDELLNAFTMLLPTNKKIISIESKPELMLAHPNWISRSIELEEEGMKIPIKLILDKSSQEKPGFIVLDYLNKEIVREAFELISQGQNLVSWTNASNLNDLKEKMLKEKIPSDLLEKTILIFTETKKIKGFEVIVFDKVYEINKPEKDLKAVKVFEFDAKNNRELFYPLKSNIIKNNLKEFSDRMKVIDWMIESKLNNYKDLFEIMRKYFENKEELMRQL